MREITILSLMAGLLFGAEAEGDDDSGNDGPGTGEEDKPDVPDDPVVEEYDITEDFTVANPGLPMGSYNRPSSPMNYTSKETGIEYTIMGCYVNNYEAPYFLLVNGKNNEGAFISFSLDADCSRIELTTTPGCSTNSNSKINFYANDELVDNYAVNVQNSSVGIDIPTEYREAGTVYKIESATTSYNQQFAGFTYHCYNGNVMDEDTSSVDSLPIGEFAETEIFDLNGRKLNIPIDSLNKGIYIVRKNNRTLKIFAK